MQGQTLRLFVAILFQVPSVLLAVTQTCGTAVGNAVLTTSFGWGGAMTASVDNNGRFVLWKDKFVQDGPTREPRVSITEVDVHLSSLKTIRGFAGQATTGADRGLFVAVDSIGSLDFVSPGTGVLPIALPESFVVSAASLYRSPSRLHERDLFPMQALHAPEEMPGRRSGKEARAMVAQRAKLAPVDLFVVSGTQISRLQVHFRDMEGQPPELQRALLSRVAKVTYHPQEADKPERPPVIRPMDVPIIDLRACRYNDTFWALTDDPEIAMSVSCVVPMGKWGGKDRIESVDFLQALSREHLLVGTELGQVEVVESKTGKLTYAPRFSKPVWLKAVTGFTIGERTEIWALDSNHQLYQWSSKAPEEKFAPITEPLPGGTVAQSLSVAAEPLAAVSPSDNSGGFFSYLRPEGDELTVERILVLGNDNRLYAWGAVPTDQVFRTLEEPTRTWITHPPLPPTSRED